MTAAAANLVAGFVAAGASAAAIPLVLRGARQAGRLLDVPNVRSSHTVPRPRGGGLGILSGLALGSVALHWLGGTLGGRDLLLLAAAFLAAAMGFWDDVRTLPVWPRLLAQIVVALAVSLSVGTLDTLPLPAPLDFPLGPLGIPATVVWLVGVMNFFNFMDGIDGLAGGQALASCAGIVLAGWSADAVSIASILLGATAGFLLFNWPPARIFLGDAGSMPVGFLLAGLPLLSPARERGAAVLAVAVGLSLFLLDPLATLIRRAREGKRIGQAHRDHAYQRLVSPGESHGRVTTALVLAALLLSGLGALAFRFPRARWPALAVAVLAFALESALAHREDTRRAARAPGETPQRPH